MTHPLHHSVSLDKGSQDSPQNDSPQDIAENRDSETARGPAEAAASLDRQFDLALDTQTLQIFESSDDWITILDLQGRILFMSRSGRRRLGIQDAAPLNGSANLSWLNLWPESEQQAAIDAIARTGAGEVCSLQGCGPTLSGDLRWWDSKLSPMVGANGQIERLLCISRDITDRQQIETQHQQTEAALRWNQETFSALIADAPFGVYTIDAAFRIQQANHAASAVFNIEPLLGRDLAEALRIIWQEPFATEAIDRFRRTLATGEPYYSPLIVERRADVEETQSYDWQIHRITLPDGSYGVVCYFYNLSEIKRAEDIIRRDADRDAFLVTLNDALRPLTDAIEIQATASRVLGEYLNTNRVTYFEVRGADYVVEQDYVNGVESLSGGYPIESFGAELLAIYRSGQTATSADVMSDPWLAPAQRTAFAGIQTAAYIGVPLVKQNEFVAGLAVHSSTPRRWTTEEIALAESVAERTWAAVERAQAEANLRESEARLATDLAGMQRLYNLYATLATGLDLQTALGEILAVACEFTHTDRGCVQLMSDDGTRLEMFAWLGYSDDSPFINHFRYEGFEEGCDTVRVARQRFLLEETVGYPGLDGTEAGAAVYAEGIRAAQSTPIINRSNQTIGVLSTQFSQPHRPSDDELRLVDLLAWTAADFVERYRAHQALRESEEKYRSLFESIDEGFCLIEMLFDANDRPVDYRFLDLNPIFEQQTGLQQAVGKTARQLVPDLEEFWFETYGRVALTGEPVRFENGSAPMNRWFDVYACRIGQPQDRRVAIVFKDISVRKRREADLAFLAELGEDFSRLSTADEIMQAVGAKIGAYLQITTCDFTDVDDVNDHLTVHYGWNSPEVPSTVGSFRTSQYLSEEFVRANRAGETVVVCNTQTDPRTDAAGYAAFDMYSFVTVPFHQNGRWTHYIAICDSRPRDWRDDEIQLIEEISNRIFPRLERARVEAALRVSEEKYRTILTSMDEAFFIAEMLFDDAGTAVDYRYLEVNPAFYTHAGLSETVVGRTMGEVVQGQPIPWLPTYAQVVETRQPIRFEYDVEMAEVRGYYDVHLMPLEEPNKRCVAAIFQNISDRKRAEVERQQTEAAIAADLRDTQLLRDLSARLVTEESIQALYQEIMATAIALTGADAGTVQILDEATQDLVLIATQGIEPQMAKHFRRINAGSNTPCGIALRSGIRSFVDFDVPASHDPDGSMRLHVEAGLLSAQSTPLLSRSGRPIGMVSTHWRSHHRPSERELRFLDLLARQAADLIEQRQDAAQRKQLLEREQAARAEAERANRIKDEFLAVLSHELRSPLNPILGWSKLLQSGKLDAAKTAQALTTIERNAKLQSELIEDLLDVSRILRGKLSLNVAQVNLAATIRAAVETVRLAAEAKSIQITECFAPDVDAVAGDATRLQQVAWNLISNAVKFTPTGGRVEVRLEVVDSTDRGDGRGRGEGGNQTAPPASLSSPACSYAQITVSDTGQGIAPDFLPHVFDYFRQADGATTRKFGGLGLGLAIVRHLVELHGGTVSVASPGAGQGATFTVRLPLMSVPSADLEEQPPHQSPDLSGIKILIVDDEIDARDLVTFILEQQGAEVIGAASAFEALPLLSQTQPDILLSDIGMPEMDGYMLIRQVRMLAPERGGGIPAIALTAYAGDTNQQQVLAAGFQKHLAKPLEPELLIQAIVSLVRPA